jgi:hypothetical protein
MIARAMGRGKKTQGLAMPVLSGAGGSGNKNSVLNYLILFRIYGSLPFGSDKLSEGIG